MDGCVLGIGLHLNLLLGGDRNVAVSIGHDDELSNDIAEGFAKSN